MIDNTVNYGAVNQTESAKMKKNIRGTIAAATLSSLGAGVLTYPLSYIANNKLQGHNISVKAEQAKDIFIGAEKILNEMTDLSKKGVKIVNLKPILNLSPMPDNVLATLDPIFAASQGKNAFFISKDSQKLAAGYPSLDIGKNKILINQEKMALPVFHEIGHAFNANSSTFWKYMQKFRGSARAIATIAAIFPAFTKNTKPEDGKELTTSQKIKNGLRKAAPAIAVLATAPIVLEEGMASFRGNKWAKQLLSPEIAKKVSKSNAYGFATYVLMAISMGLTAKLAQVIKDKSDNKLEQKNKII